MRERGNTNPTIAMPLNKHSLSTVEFAAPPAAAASPQLWCWASTAPPPSSSVPLSAAPGPPPPGSPPPSTASVFVVPSSTAVLLRTSFRRPRLGVHSSTAVLLRNSFRLLSRFYLNLVFVWFKAALGYDFCCSFVCRLGVHSSTAVLRNSFRLPRNMFWKFGALFGCNVINH